MHISDARMKHLADMANWAHIVVIGILTILTVAALVAIIISFAGDTAEHVTLLLSQAPPAVEADAGRPRSG